MFLALALLAGATPFMRMQGQTPTLLPPVKLRGYGELSGQWRMASSDGKPGSILQIQCESEDKAKIVQAKYLSDLQVLPGVTAITLQGQEGPLAAYAFPLGAFLAAREGKNVFILTSDSPEGLAALEKTTLAHGHLSFAPEVEVPMFLDRWDKYGFRFYYVPTSTPDGKNLTTYNKTEEMDWSQKNQTGFQCWDPVYEHDNAAGFTSRNEFQWVADESHKRKLPLGINLSSNNQLWLENWYPDEMAQHMPQFIGGYYNGPLSGEDGERFISWNSTIAEDLQLATIQQDVRHFKTYDNVTSWLEPHGEMGHGDSDFLMEYGPVADKTFRTWLQNKYQTLEAVSQRWKGKPDGLKSWDDVHVPEMASFSGWGPDALDLTGPWKVLFIEGEVKPGTQPPFPMKAFAPEFDDRAWPEITAPGDDHVEFIPKYRPAVFRRNFMVDKGWLKAHPKIWLYVFDLNRTRDQDVIATLNGQEVGRSKIWDPTCHRDWFEVTSAIHEGPNTLVLGLPSGYLGYRLYLSGSEPRLYPSLGPGLNALWADFADWACWSRVQKVERGMEMIRQEDPNRGILLMSPGPFYAGEQTLAKRYGGDMHDTGGMGGWWNDFLPQLMAGVGLPNSVEPSQPAHNVEELHSGFGKWSTEGINGMDYFLKLGDVFWDDAIRADFEENLKQWKLIGKYHPPSPGYATFYSGRNANLLSFPWNRNDLNLVVPPGFPRWGWSSEKYPRPFAVTEAEFFSGAVDKYPVVIDSNSEILDQDLIDAITAYVKQGGIFVTYVQTGRHTSTEPNSWPIQQLTGYSVIAIDPYQAGSDLEDSRGIDLAPNQAFFNPEKWDAKTSGGGSGLSLKKIAPECQDLLLWKDGTIAAGMRHLGKGYVFDFGVKYDSVGWGETQGISQLFDAVLDFARLTPEPARLENITLDPSVTQADANTRGIIYRHYLSNNGLYDVWAFWNSNVHPLNADLIFHDIAPTSAIEVKTGESYPLDKNAEGLPVMKVHLQPNESESFLTPRAHLEMASKEWFDLQREWWKGTTTPPDKKLPSVESLHKYTFSLNDGWAWKNLADQEDSAPLAAATLDDSKWAKGDFQATLVTPIPEKSPPRRAIWRRHFTVPKAWDKGSVTLWITPSEGGAMINKGLVYCDGTLMQTGENVICQTFGDRFKPGSAHTLAVEIQSTASLFGNIGNAWLYYRPDPVDQIDLSGNWDASDDGLVFDKQLTLPGAWDAHVARAAITIASTHAKQTVLMHFEVDGRISGVIINGTLVSRTHVQNTPQFDLNLTPWIHFGQDNRFELVYPGKGTAMIKSLSLDFYDPGTFP